MLSKEELNKLYTEQRFSTTEIGMMLGVHGDTVLNWLKKYNIPRKQWQFKEPFGCQIKWFYKAYVEKGMSTREIGKLLGINHKTVIYWLKKCKIETRSQEDSMKGIWSKRKHPHLGKKGKLSYMYGKKMSESNKQKLKEANTGANNASWRGGISHHSQGYICRAAKEHPKADMHGYVLEHRLVMEKILGRYLKDNEIVHHINGIKDDNRPENLMLFSSRRDHVKYHLYLKEEKINVK